jgi:3-oxoadipate enol-lactonase
MKATINHIDVDYLVHGNKGPWIILSHSLGCTKAMWEPQIEMLEKSFRVITYDTRGHGGSGSAGGQYTLDLLADDALGLLDYLGVEKVHWLGFSMGGMIGQTFALRYPERLASIVLADTTSAHTATPVSMWEERIRIAKTQGMDPLVQPAINRWFTETFRNSSPNVVEPVASMIRSTSVDGWAGCCAAIASIHTTDRLKEIECPAMVIVGEFDVGTPLSAALEMHNNLKQSVLVLISNAAHMTNIEQPAQFNRALELFYNTFKQSDTVAQKGM